MAPAMSEIIAVPTVAALAPTAEILAIATPQTASLTYIQLVSADVIIVFVNRVLTLKRPMFRGAHPRKPFGGKKIHSGKATAPPHNPTPIVAKIIAAYVREASRAFFSDFLPME